MRQFIVTTLLAFVVLFVICPSAFLHPSDTLPASNDTRLIAYIIGQVQNNLLHSQPLYFGTFFAPYNNTLTFSEPFIVSAIVTLPARFVTNNPILIFNLAFIIGSILTFISLFIFLHYLLMDKLLALTTTIIFFLSGFHLTYLPHLQLFSLWPMLLAIYFFSRYLKESRPILIDLFFLMVTFQLAESFFPVYLIFFSILFLYLAKPVNLKNIFSRSLLFLPFWFLLLFPYLKLNATFPEAYRPIRDAAHFSLGLEEIFTSYHSFVFICIFVFSLLLKNKKASSLTSHFLLLTFSLILSLGPVLKLFGHSVKILGLPIPLPYTLFYYLFPGFQGLRTPSRFIILAALAATIIIGLKLLPFYEKLKNSTKYFLLLTLTLILILESRLPLPGYPVDITQPSVYQEVKKLPNNAIILELPIKLWVDDNHEIESLRSLYSLVHRHRRLGGFSGFSPLAWIDLVNKINAHGLDQTNLDHLRSLGITHVVEGNKIYPL